MAGMRGEGRPRWEKEQEWMNKVENTARHHILWAFTQARHTSAKEMSLSSSSSIHSVQISWALTICQVLWWTHKTEGWFRKPTTKPWRSIKRPPQRTGPDGENNRDVGGRPKERGVSFREMRKKAGIGLLEGNWLHSVPPHPETYRYTLQLPSMCKSATSVVTCAWPLWDGTGLWEVSGKLEEDPQSWYRGQGDSSRVTGLLPNSKYRKWRCSNFFIRAAMKKKNYKRLDKLLLWNKSLLY